MRPLSFAKTRWINDERNKPTTNYTNKNKQWGWTQMLYKWYGNLIKRKEWKPHQPHTTQSGRSGRNDCNVIFSKPILIVKTHCTRIDKGHRLIAFRFQLEHCIENHDLILCLDTIIMVSRFFNIIFTLFHFISRNRKWLTQTKTAENFSSSEFGMNKFDEKPLQTPPSSTTVAFQQCHYCIQTLQYQINTFQLFIFLHYFSSISNSYSDAFNAVTTNIHAFIVVVRMSGCRLSLDRTPSDQTTNFSQK